MSCDVEYLFPLTGRNESIIKHLDPKLRDLLIKIYIIKVKKKTREEDRMM